MQGADDAIVVDMLLRRFPGYGCVDDLLAEHSEVVDAFLVIAQEEGIHQARENKRLESLAKK